MYADSVCIRNPGVGKALHSIIVPAAQVLNLQIGFWSYPHRGLGCSLPPQSDTTISIHMSAKDLKMLSGKTA